MWWASAMVRSRSSRQGAGDGPQPRYQDGRVARIVSLFFAASMAGLPSCFRNGVVDAVVNHGYLSLDAMRVPPTWRRLLSSRLRHRATPSWSTSNCEPCRGVCQTVSLPVPAISAYPFPSWTTAVSWPPPVDGLYRRQCPLGLAAYSPRYFVATLVIQPPIQLEHHVLGHGQSSPLSGSHGQG